MATITKSIGTSSRDYSTITAWEADLDNTGIYTSGDDAVGECYNDSDFTESVTINGGATVGLNSLKLSVASGERHDGTQGTGARILGAYTQSTTTVNGNFSSTIEWLDLDGNSQLVSVLATWTSTAIAVFNNLLVHDVAGGSSGSNYNGILTNSIRDALIKNCIVYNNSREGSADTKLIFIDGERSGGGLYNNTCYNSTNTGPGEGVGIYVATSSSNFIVKNNLCVGDSDFSGFVFTGTDTVSDYNLSSDDSADDAGGSNNIINATTANQFASTVSGSEDLHIVSTSDAVGAGADLATTSIDINGSDRNALAATVWDIGAHQYASTASIGTSSRDYSTIALWEADLDDTTIYGAGANAVGELYNDSTFTINTITDIDGGVSIGVDSVTLKSASGEGHDGTADTGVKLEFTQIRANRNKVTVDQIEIDSSYPFSGFANLLHAYGNSSIAHGLRANRMLLHGTGMTNTASAVSTGARTLEFFNSIIYSCDTGGVTLYNSIFGRYSRAANITIYNCSGYGLQGWDDSYINIHNIISVGNSGNDFERSYSLANVSNNISSDGTATGTNSQTNKSAANQFVSTLSGSEDLHIVETSDAFGAGVDLGTVVDGVQYDIDGQNRDTFVGTTWDIGADQVKTPASIGTSSRDYSTIALWEADLDDTSLYTSGDDAVGECYNDSAFDEIITINGGSTVGLSSTKLSVASGQRHDGTSGSGARIVKASQGSGNRVLTIDIFVARIIEWLEIDSNSYRGDIYWDLSGSSASAIARNMIVHDNFHDNPNGSNARGLNGTPGTFLNNIVYNITTERSSSFGATGTGGSGSASQVLVYNCTVHNIVNNNGAGAATAIYSRDLSNHEVKNCIATNVTGTSTGSLVGFNSTSSTVKSNNISSDGTASGTGSKTNQPASRQFVSTLSGSEDLHLIFKSAAIDAGVDLGTTPDGVQYDINGKDRDTENSIWDIGAHEYGDNVVFGLLRV